MDIENGIGDSSMYFSWGDLLGESARTLWSNFVDFAPSFVLAVVFFVAGYFIASLLAEFIEHLFRVGKVDHLLRAAKLDEFFKKIGMKLNSGYFFGQLVRWFVIVVSLVFVMDFAGLDQVNDFLMTDVLGFLKKIILAALILLISIIVAEAVSKAVSAAAKGVNVTSANIIGVVTKYTILVFAFVEALEKLDVGSTTVGFLETLFSAVVAMLALAGGLAFGLGGKEAASRCIAKLSDEMSHKNDNTM